MRKGTVGQIDKVGEDMSLQVVDLHHRDIQGDRQSLGKRRADQQRAQKTGPTGKGDAVDLRTFDTGFAQGRVDDRNDILLVGP